MPEKTSATDRYLAEIERLLDLHGRERRRALAMVRKRLAAFEAEERKRGVSEAEAEKPALARMGAPEQLVEDLCKRALTVRARDDAQIVLAAFIPIALAMVAVAFEVIEIRLYRDSTFGNSDGFFHHYQRLGIWLPPPYLALKLILGAALVVVALVLAESALAYTRNRRRLSAGLTLLGGLALTVVVALQIAFAFEWHRLHLGHGAWLLAAIVVETGTVLVLSVFLVRSARAVLPPGLAPLARAPMLVVLALTLLLAVTAKSGFSSTDLCTPTGYCGPPPETLIAWTTGHPVNVSLLTGPAGSQGAVALKGRRLAFVTSSWRKQKRGGAVLRESRKGPVDLAVWEGRWPVSQPGPCGATSSPSMDRLAPTTQTDCDILYPRSHPGTSWRVVARLPEPKAGAVAIAYRSNGRLAIAYSRPGGVYVAEAPSWRPERLLDTRAESIRLAPLAGGDLVLAAIVSRPGGSELELSRSHGERWSRPISIAARPGLNMVSGSSQIALTFRDRTGQLVLERRTDNFALLEHRSFGVHTRAALGTLRGGEIGIAVADPLRGHALQLRLYRVSRKTVILLTQERVSTYKPGAMQTATLTADVTVKVAQERLTGVVQTGRVVRALYGGLLHGHTTKHVLVSLWLYEGRLVFASDWPRWATLVSRSEKEQTFGRPTAGWTSFNLILFQPPARQLTALDTKH